MSENSQQEQNGQAPAEQMVAGPAETETVETVEAVEAAEAEAGYRAEYEAITETAVEALTAMARLRHPRFGQANFAEFLAHACSAAAANVGSVGSLLAGRSGSWEADLVAQLVNGTVGWDGEYLAEHRTEPVVIHLNVHRLLEDRAAGPSYLTPYQAAEHALQAEEARWDAEHAEDDYEQWDRARAEAGWEARYDELLAVWATRYHDFAAAFTAAVQAEAARIDGLAVPVTVEAITDPDAAYDDGPAHPDWGDGLVWRLWEQAITTVPLPGDDQSGDEPVKGGAL